jgi:hypothetical protein
MYSLRLYHDTYAPGATPVADLKAQHSNVYVVAGSATINGTRLGNDEAAYAADVLSIEPGPEGATIWRWDLVRTCEPDNLAAGEGITSRLAMARKIKMFELVPTSKWLFRLDSIIGMQGTTGLHSHPGSGIRCMLEGQMRVESDKGESRDNRGTGSVWYEEGSYPLVSTTDPGNTATFLRGMVLPPEYARFTDAESPTWIEGVKPCTNDYRNYVQTVVTLI